MSNIVLKTDVVNQTVIPGLTSVIDKIKSAQSKCSSLQSLLPSSFPNTAQVSKLSYSLNNSVSDVLEAKKTISQKVDYANNIESKHASKSSSLLSKLGGVAGAIFGSATGGVVGAVAGGIIGSKVAEPIVKTGAKIVKGFVSGVGKLIKGVGSGIAKGAKAIVNTGAKIVKGFVSGAKKVVTAVGKGIAKVGKALINTGAKIVKGFVSGVKKVGKAIGDGIKWAGGKIAQGAKAIAGFATKAAKGIWNGLKAAGNWVWNGLKKVGATIANVVVSLVEGIVSFVEAIGDFVVLALGAVGTVFTGFADIVRGIATGEWDWASTSALWKKGVLPVVAYNWTDKVFSALYETKAFKAIENNAAGWAKRDGGIGYSIGKGVGYYVGVIVATAFTCGAAGAGAAAASTASGAVTSFAVTAAVSGAAELGKATQNNYNSAIDKNVLTHYAQQELEANPNLTKEQAIELAENNIKNGVYKDFDSVKKYQMDNISGGEVGKIMAASTTQAVIEGVVTGVLRTKIKLPTEVASGAPKVAKFASSLTRVQDLAIKSGDKVIIGGLGKAGVQVGKAYIKEGTTMIVDGDYDFKKATIDASAGALTEVIAGTFKASDLTEKALSKVKNTKVVNTVANSKAYNGVKNFVGGVTNKVKKTYTDMKTNIFGENQRSTLDSKDGLTNLDNPGSDQKSLTSMIIDKTKKYFQDGKSGVKEYMLDKSKVDVGGTKEKTTSFRGLGHLILDKGAKDSYKTGAKEGVINPISEKLTA